MRVGLFSATLVLALFAAPAAAEPDDPYGLDALPSDAPPKKSAKDTWTPPPTPEPTDNPSASPTADPSPHVIGRPLPGFQDVRFGESPQSVTATFARRYRPMGKADNGSLVFKGTVAGLRDSIVSASFFNRRLCRVAVVLYPQDGLNTIGLFRHITNNIEDKYGPSNSRYLFRYRNGSIDFNDIGYGTIDEASYDLLNQSAAALWVWRFKDSNEICARIMRGDEFPMVSIVYRHKGLEKLEQRRAVDDL